MHWIEPVLPLIGRRDGKKCRKCKLPTRVPRGTYLRVIGAPRGPPRRKRWHSLEWSAMFQLTQFAREAGFSQAGIVSLAQPLPELDFFPGWIDCGAAGEMDYLKSRDEHGALKRASVQQTF